jgi:hypothetical protein
LGVITYFELNREVIAEIHCINKEKPIRMCKGQCFLDKKLALADDTNQNQAPSGKEKIEFPTFILDDAFALNDFTHLRADNNTHYSDTISSQHLATPFHPPTAG